jgi:hypothetical protein
MAITRAQRESPRSGPLFYPCGPSPNPVPRCLPRHPGYGAACRAGVRLLTLRICVLPLCCPCAIVPACAPVLQVLAAAPVGSAAARTQALLDSDFSHRLLDDTKKVVWQVSCSLAPWRLSPVSVLRASRCQCWPCGGRAIKGQDERACGDQSSSSGSISSCAATCTSRCLYWHPCVCVCAHTPHTRNTHTCTHAWLA